MRGGAVGCVDRGEVVGVCVVRWVGVMWCWGTGGGLPVGLWSAGVAAGGFRAVEAAAAEMRDGWWWWWWVR